MCVSSLESTSSRRFYANSTKRREYQQTSISTLNYTNKTKLGYNVTGRVYVQCLAVPLYWVKQTRLQQLRLRLLPPAINQ
jgi:hypothetical protein